LGAASTNFSNPIPAFTSGSPPASRPAQTRRARPPALQTAPAFFGVALKNRLGMLYLSFTLAFLGLCLGFRQLAPARLPSYR
jgi:hypothetical protein